MQRRFERVAEMRTANVMNDPDSDRARRRHTRIVRLFDAAFAAWIIFNLFILTIGQPRRAVTSDLGAFYGTANSTVFMSAVAGVAAILATTTASLGRRPIRARKRDSASAELLRAALALSAFAAITLWFILGVVVVSFGELAFEDASFAPKVANSPNWTLIMAGSFLVFLLAALISALVGLVLRPRKYGEP